MSPGPSAPGEFRAFVLIANSWQAGVTNPTSKHRIALELARLGHRVLWIEGAGMRVPSLGSGSDRSRILRKVARAFGGARRAEASGHIEVVSPLLLPLPRRAWARRLNGWMCARIGRRWAGRGGTAPVLVNYVPVLSHALAGWRGVRVYHCVDRWDAFRMYDSAVMAACDEQCCRWADLVIASSADLAERCRRFSSRVRLVPHGVDHGHFARALDAGDRPADLPAGPVIGFFGLLSEWVDQDLLVRTARAVPDCSLALIGTADVPVDRLKAEPNILVLGPRPFADLPRYLAHFTVGMIPFVVNELTRAVNPIKLREMLAGGCPVVSTALPEVCAMADAQPALRGSRGVRVAQTADEFVACVRRFAAQPLGPDERRRLSEAVASETWASKVREILDLIRSEEPAGGKT